MGSTKVGKQKRFLEHNISAQPFKVFKLTDSIPQKEARECWKIDPESDNEKPMQLGCRNSEKSSTETRGYIPESAPSECLQARSIPCQEVSKLQSKSSDSSKCKESFTFEGKLNDLNRLQEDSEKEKIAINLVAIDSPTELKRLLFMFILQSVLKAQKVQRSMPLPVLIADKELDLFRLRQKVKEMESNRNLSSEEWGQVATFLGFTSNYGPSLKSIYTTYLKPLENRQVLEFYGGKVTAMVVNTIEEIITKCSSIKQDCEVASTATLVTDFEPFSAVRPCECEKFEGIQCLEDDEVCSFKNGLVHPIHLVTPVNNLDSEKRKLSGDRMTQASCLAEGKCLDNKGCESDASAPQSPISGQLELSSRGQRWQEDNLGTNEVQVNEGSNEGILYIDSNYDHLKNALQWMKIVALNPGDLMQGQGPRGSGQNKQWVDECTAIACKFRSCLWKRSRTLRASRLNKADHTQFSKYYDEALYEGHNSSDRLMVSRNLKKGQVFARPFFNEHLIVDLHGKPLTGSHGNIKSLQLPAKLVHELTDFSSHGTFRKRIPIGPDFQADVPPCSPETYPVPTIHRGRISCSSHEVDRWLGRQVWPLPGGKRVMNKERIGRGRPLSCCCPIPESSACHRSHIRLEKAQLMIEIDDAFSIWGFDEMGENALACWTKEEQETFQVIIKTNPASAERSFWNELLASFPSRNMRDLVSYYFNIYVLRGREIQNRLHLEEVDSDDDEDELSKAYIKKMNSAPSFLK